MEKKNICFATFVRNEIIRLPIWLNHYRQFSSDDDIYIIDQNTTDGSTQNLKCNVIYEPHEGIFDHQWLRQMLTRNLQKLLQYYHIVILTECDLLMVTHNNEKLDNYLIKNYLNSSKNGCTDLYDVVQQPDEKKYILGDKISQIRNYLSYWSGAKTHIIHTYNNCELQNGFHGGTGILDNNLSSIHIQALNTDYFYSKINQRIKEKEKYGSGDNHACWELHYKINYIENHLKDLNSRNIPASLWFKNNIYI